jgi:hypothetical protein
MIVNWNLIYYLKDKKNQSNGENKWVYIKLKNLFKKIKNKKNNLYMVKHKMKKKLLT